MPTTSYSQSSGAPDGIIPALRVLCLHDSGSNATELSDRLEALGERLYENHAIDLVYVNSPLLVRQAGRVSKEQNRIWWDEQREEGKYDGLDAALLLLRQVWTSMPFWGILAVGHGAAVGSFLSLMPDLQLPAFCIFVNGESLLEEEERLVDNLPCLHVLSPNPGPSAEKLLKQFGGTVHQGGSNFTKPTINAIGKFIVSHKKQLRQQTADTKILALQNLLYMKEQEAATAVAQHIAANPPKALQAVISPQAVGGFSGRKRNPAGGGAPCPSEFLLKKEKRAADVSVGPSREHPSQSQNQQQSQSQQSHNQSTADKEKEETAATTCTDDGVDNVNNES